MATKEDVYELARNNPAVHMAVSAVFAGLVSWEDAMMELVVVLVKMNKEQQDILIDMSNKNYQPIIFVKDR